MPSDCSQCLPASEDFGILPKTKEVYAYKKAQRADIYPILQRQIQLGGALPDDANMEIKESTWASLPKEVAEHGRKFYEACHLESVVFFSRQIPVHLRSYERNLDLGFIPFWNSTTEYSRLVDILGKRVPSSVFSGLSDDLDPGKQIQYQFSFPGLTFPLRKVTAENGDVVQALRDMAETIQKYFTPGLLNRRLQDIQSVRHRDEWPIGSIDVKKIRLVGLYCRKVNESAANRLTKIYMPILALDP